MRDTIGIIFLSTVAASAAPGVAGLVGLGVLGCSGGNGSFELGTMSDDGSTSASGGGSGNNASSGASSGSPSSGGPSTSSGAGASSGAGGAGGSGGGGASSSGGGGSSSGGGSGGSSGSATGTDASLQDAAGGGGSGADAASHADAAKADGATPGVDASSGDDGGVQPYRGGASYNACGDLATLGDSWWYNWNTNPGSCNAQSPFVPMVWGHTGNEQTMAGITSEVGAMVKAGYRYVLGFNEPDNTGQSNLSVATAISLWPAFNNPAILVGSPATQGNSTGLTWIKSFMSQVDADTTGSMRVDFIATHWYGWNSGSCDANATNLESWIKGIEAIPGNRPIWITEFGCLNQSNPSSSVVQAFLSGAIAMLAKHPRVQRYSWYQFTTNNELLTSGALTGIGMVYAAAPATH